MIEKEGGQAESEGLGMRGCRGRVGVEGQLGKTGSVGRPEIMDQMLGSCRGPRMCQPGPAFSRGLETSPDPWGAARMEMVSLVWSGLPPNCCGTPVTPFASPGLHMLGEVSRAEVRDQVKPDSPPG